MALTTQLASYTTSVINPLLESTALAAAKYCDAGTNGTQCIMWWNGAAGPATLGVGQQMSALNVFNANMVKFMNYSVDTASSGGTSQGNPEAGSPTSDQIDM